MKKLIILITLFISFACSSPKEDNSELFLGKWTYTDSSEKGAFNFPVNYIVEIKRQDNESLKVTHTRVSDQNQIFNQTKSYIIYKKSATTYVSDNSEYTYALNMETGNVELNGKEYKKEMKL